jgi:hypothetical protein
MPVSRTAVCKAGCSQIEEAVVKSMRITYVYHSDIEMLVAVNSLSISGSNADFSRPTLALASRISDCL